MNKKVLKIKQNELENIKYTLDKADYYYEQNRVVEAIPY